MSTAVFAANNDSYRKRKRAHRACCQCKRRRRRCEALLESHGRCTSCMKDGIECSLSGFVISTPDGATLLPDRPELGRDTSDSHRRFVGDLNPESVFLTSQCASVEVHRDITECGIWEDSPTPSGSSTPRQFLANISPAYLSYLESINAFNLPEKGVQDALIKIYLDTIHPFLPILDVPNFLKSHAKNTVSLPLLLAVLLVAIKHPDAAPLLPVGVAPRTFATSIAEKIAALLHGGIEKDRLTLTRIHTFLALHSEGPGGNESASLHVSTALHHAYSIGLHLNRQFFQKTLSDVSLWWSLWALDAVQAVICGRPLGVRREDVSVPFPTAVHGIETSPAFTTLLAITEVLIEIIALYRPGKTSGWTGDWPVFTDFGEGETGDTLRLFYHAVCILSHRNVTGSSSDRRTESARSILTLCTTRKEWLPLPIVPYAVALALTVFYTTLREDKGEFMATCEVLDELAGSWWFAGAMARMGKQALEKAKTQEAAAALRVLGGHEAQAEEELENENEWFLQLFPDLALPADFYEGLVGWDEIGEVGPLEVGQVGS